MNSSYDKDNAGVYNRAMYVDSMLTLTIQHEHLRSLL